ncbi:MAG: N-acetylmuramoyl-L-alanine amidase [Atopobiaceae bacterium]|nr:N-acetylmuramoyl-L-alanine amidase [Atopobiaceae bacterium]
MRRVAVALFAAVLIVSCMLAVPAHAEEVLDEGSGYTEAALEQSQGNTLADDGEVLDGELPEEGELGELEEEPSSNDAAVEKGDDEGAADDEPVGENPSEVGPAAAEVSEVGASEPSESEEVELTPQATKPSVTYQAHVQNVGWQSYVRDGALAGTTGRSLRVEGIRIKLVGTDIPSGGIEYRMHVQNIGWQGWSKDGAMGGTQGRSLRVEAFQLRLYGAVADQYDVWYRVHVQNVGWMAWAKNGEYAGSSGHSLRMESLQIRLAPKGETPSGIGSSDVSYAYFGDLGLKVSAHVQNIGWQASVGNGQTCGTTGRALRMEAIRLSLDDSGISGSIQYQAHVQDIGWQDWKVDGELAGTVGRSKQVEAVKIKLASDVASKYDIYYRAHVQGIGWMTWAKNGASSGTIGLGLRVEALQVQLVAKGGAAPSNAGRAYRGAAVDASVPKPAGLTVKRVRDLEHGYKSPLYQRCIVLHDTTEIRDFDYWQGLWRSRGGVSVQFMIKQDGSIRQYIDMNQIGYHAGSPTYAALDSKYGVVKYCNNGSAMNQCSIGIEIEHVIDGSDYPKAQLDALDSLIAYIDAYYGFPCTILQHKDYQSSSPDCSKEFQGYLRNLQDHRTTR